MAAASTPAPQRQLPPLAWAGLIGGVVLLVVLVTLLALQLAVLTDSRQHIRAQDAKITQIIQAGRDAKQGAGPALRAARPLLRQAPPLVRQVRAGLRSLEAAGPSALDAARSIGPLLRTTEALASNAIPLVGELTRGGRLTTLLDDQRALIEQIRVTSVVTKVADAADLAPEAIGLLHGLLHIQLRTLRVQRENVRLQKSALRTQRRTFRLLRTSLDIQRRTLAATESIDRKTGGRLPAAAPSASP